MAIIETPATTSTAQGAAIVGSPSASSGPGPQIMSADTLEGNDVYNNADEKLGTIEHIMLDVSHGSIAYAVLARGGVLGIGEKLHAIPWGALTLDTDRKCFMLDIDKTQLKESDGFDKDHWPTFADTVWATDLHTRYGRKPYWDVRSF